MNQPEMGTYGLWGGYEGSYVCGAKNHANKHQGEDDEHIDTLANQKLPRAWTNTAPTKLVQEEGRGFALNEFKVGGEVGPIAYYKTTVFNLSALRARARGRVEWYCWTSHRRMAKDLGMA